MESQRHALNQRDSRTMDPAALTGLLVMTALLLAGCSPDSGSPPPQSSEAGPAVAQSQGLETATASTPPIPAGPPVATPGDASPLTTGPAQNASPPPRASAPVAGAASPKVAAPQPTVIEAKPVPPSPATESTPMATRPVPDPSPVPPPAKAPAAPTSVDIGGLVEVGATKAGLSRIGSVKCKLCHKVQFDSWAKTAHAARTPPLDCESCHGPGSEYKALAIMKDAGKSKAAGLVTPTRSFCSKCHTTGWSDDLLKRSHAHKTGN